MLLHSRSHLPRFQPLAPRKIFYLNQTTSSDLMTELIHRVQKTNQFIIMTKYDYAVHDPALIQILFTKELKTYIILIEVKYLPNDQNSILFRQIQVLLSIILCPVNFIQSWGNIKMELTHFLRHHLFFMEQIEQMRAINIQQKFTRWFDKLFDHTEDCYEIYDPMNDHSCCTCMHRPFSYPYDEWSLEMAMAFTFQLYFNTSLTHNHWHIGLYLYFDSPLTTETTNTNNNAFDLPVPYEKQRRSVLSVYAIQESLAINKFVSLLQNAWIRRHTEEYLKNYYNN
jgi:hypothetical protein